MNLGGIVDSVVAVLRDLKRTILLFIVSWAAFTVVPLRLNDVGNALSASGVVRSSASVLVLRAMESYLLPSGERIITVGPFDAFSMIMEIGAVLALAVTLPFVAVKLFRIARGKPYTRPDGSIPLNRETGKPEYIGAASGPILLRIRSLCIAAIGLFFLGSAMMFYLLPWIYGFMLNLQGIAGTENTVSLVGFVQTSLLFTFGVGLGFELPLLLIGLAYVGIVKAETMKVHWRKAFMVCGATAFLISPGVGGGIVEGIVGVSLFGLYYGSYVVIRRMERTAVRQRSIGVTA